MVCVRPVLTAGVVKTEASTETCTVAEPKAIALGLTVFPGRYFLYFVRLRDCHRRHVSNDDTVTTTPALRKLHG
jgi:hypothetical protein